jgi:PadR family transcriptional regulator, regulatory protein PadR
VKQTQMLKGALDVAVLAAVRSGETYGYDVLRMLDGAGLGAVGEASVYGTLRRLEAERLLESRLAASNEGPARRYYRTTPAGDEALEQWSADWRRVAAALELLLDARGDAA